MDYARHFCRLCGKVADGDVTIIKMGGFEATFDPTIVVPKPGPGRIDGITFKRVEDAPGQMVSDCGTLPAGTNVVGILSEGVQLPDNLVIDNKGNVLIPGSFTADVRFNISKQKKKYWINLKNGIRYYVYYIAVTSKGVRLISIAISEQCF